MRLRRSLLASLLLLPLIALAPEPAAAGGAPTFIVTLADAASPRAVAAEHARKYGAEVKYVYEHALRGYAAKVSEARIGELARDSRVVRVERDGAVTKSAVESWGLDRIDQRLGTDGSYSAVETGAGVTAYVIDTGIDLQHWAFSGRVSKGVDYVDGDSLGHDADGGDDCDGHGTHVAGTIGGTGYGVATAVNLVPVRVLNCSGSGTWSGVIAGLDWVAANAKAPAVANMSLGGGANSSVDAAVTNVIGKGVPVAVAAGNSSQDACRYSPARVTGAITVGATTSTDARSSYSNWGSCVDLFAPGSSIKSTWLDGGTNTISGTSMASPHAAGVAALYLTTDTDASPTEVRDALYAKTTKGIVTSAKSANNHLLYWGNADPLPAPEPTTPGPGKGGAKKSSR